MAPATAGRSTTKITINDVPGRPGLHRPVHRRVQASTFLRVTTHTLNFTSVYPGYKAVTKQ
ncbi:hypothetical protein GCM10018966_000340 [Streptomyces yanii]